jgi:hypothetical protein
LERRIAGTALGALVAVLLLGAAPARALPLLDPGFESGAVVAGGVGGWDVFGGAAFSNAQARTGSLSMLPAAGTGFVPGSVQFLPAAPGSQWSLGGYGLHVGLPVQAPAFGVLQLTFWSGPAGAGTDLGTLETSPGVARTSAQITAGSPSGTWILLDTGPVTAPPGTQSIGAYTIFVNFSGNAAPAGVYFDDLTLTAVPEASTGALLAAGLLATSARSRLRRRLPSTSATRA